MLDYVRLRAKICRTGTGAGPGVAAASAEGRQRGAGGAAPRRHHHDHARPARRAGRRAGGRPRRRRPAAAGADRTPLGGADFVGGLLGRVGAAGLDDAAQAGRTPPAAGAPRPGVGAAVGGGGPGRSRAASGRPAQGAATSIRELAALRDQLRRHPAHTDRPTARPRPASPSATCASNGTTSSSGRRSRRRPTRWRARSTGSSCCSPSAGSSTREPTATLQVTDDGRLLARIYSESDLLVAECLRGGLGGAWGPPSWRRWCRRCCTSPAATRRAASPGKPRCRPHSCGGRWTRPGGCGPDARRRAAPPP